MATASADGERADEVIINEEVTAAELKACGNEAYQRGELTVAVDFWNRAIQAHVAGMTDAGLPAFSQESTNLERSIYLNLAQGYLKLGDHVKAFRACQVVLQEDPCNIKARYRAAESCFGLRRLDDASKLLFAMLQVDPSHGEAARLLQRVKATKRQDAKKEQELAKRMSAGASGFSDGRPEVRPKPLAHLHGLGEALVGYGTETAELAARAAVEREARLAAGPAPPEPKVLDFDSFREKALARSRLYSSHTARMRQRKEVAERSVKLQWLRGQHGVTGTLDDFVSPLQEELRGIQDRDLSDAEAGDEIEDASANEAKDDGSAYTMEEMD